MPPSATCRRKPRRPARNRSSSSPAAKRIRQLEDEHDWEIEPKAKRILAGLAFRESDFDRPARAMSGGWIMRAHLARLLVLEPDLLLLDEPTNHLDLESLVWFQEYLKNYPGAILMISHDREFLNELVGSIVEIAQRSCSAIAATGTATSSKKPRARNSSSPPTRISRRKSRRSRNSPIASAPRPAKPRRRRASSSRSIAWKKSPRRPRRRRRSSSASRSRRAAGCARSR